jgi:hypothetical protein
VSEVAVPGAGRLVFRSRLSSDAVLQAEDGRTWGASVRGLVRKRPSFAGPGAPAWEPGRGRAGTLRLPGGRAVELAPAGTLRSRWELREGGVVLAELGDRAVLACADGVDPLLLLAAVYVVRVAEAGAEP